MCKRFPLPSVSVDVSVSDFKTSCENHFYLSLSFPQPPLIFGTRKLLLELVMIIKFWRKYCIVKNRHAIVPSQGKAEISNVETFRTLSGD